MSIIYSFSSKSDTYVLRKLTLMDTSYCKIDSYITRFSLKLMDYNNKDTLILDEFIYGLMNNSIISDYKINIKDTFDLMFRYICWNNRTPNKCNSDKNRFYVFNYMEFYDTEGCRPIINSYKTPKKKKKLIPRINLGVLDGRIIQYKSKKRHSMRN